jgi:rhamnosyl/mannosyltransferase
VKNKIQTIPLGMEDIRLRNYLPIVSEGKPFFLFIGVLRYYKGLSTLIKASKQVKAKIIIAGEGPEGPSLRRMAKEMDCDNVEFVGRIDEMEKFRLLASCRAFVMPSHQRSEAFGMALVEGAIFSRPLVSCEIGTGTSFVNVDGKTGFVVAPNDPDALASALNRLLENEELAHHLGRAARSRYEILFSAEAFGKCYAQLYSMGTQSLNR